MKNNSKCSVKGCERLSSSQKHQLCSAHLVRYYRDGNPGQARIAQRKTHPEYKAVKV